MSTIPQTSSNSVTLTPLSEDPRQLSESVTAGIGYSYEFKLDSVRFFGCEEPSSQREQIDLKINTFSPEPYRVKAPIPVTIIGREGEFIASHMESNIHASGDTDVEALENLKSLMLDIFETLTAEPEDRLAVKPRCQLAVLNELIEAI